MQSARPITSPFGKRVIFMISRNNTPLVWGLILRPLPFNSSVFFLYTPSIHDHSCNCENDTPFGLKHS